MEFFSSTNVDTKDNGLVGVSKNRVRRRRKGRGVGGGGERRERSDRREVQREEKEGL